MVPCKSEGFGSRGLYDSNSAVAQVLTKWLSDSVYCFSANY